MAEARLADDALQVATASEPEPQAETEAPQRPEASRPDAARFKAILESYEINYATIARWTGYHGDTVRKMMSGYYPLTDRFVERAIGVPQLYALGVTRETFYHD